MITPTLALQQRTSSIHGSSRVLCSTGPSIQQSSFHGEKPGFSTLRKIDIRREKKIRSQVIVQRMSKSERKEIQMVDPIEAKRLAVQQMQQLQAQALYKRQRVVEAINAAWAIIGLTAGIVIEGYTGKTILSQVAGYLNAIADAIEQYFPSPPS